MPETSSSLPKEAFCSYPMTGRECAQKYSDIPGVNYMAWRCLYVGLGLTALVITSSRLFISYSRGTVLQKVAFPSLVTASFTFIFRGIDPNGYGAIYSFKWYSIAEAVGNAIVYTSCYAMVVVWGALLYRQRGTFTLAKGINVVGMILVTGTWAMAAFSVAIDFEGAHTDATILRGISLAIWAWLGISGGVYLTICGVALHRRLEKSLQRATSSAQSLRTLADDYVLNFGSEIHEEDQVANDCSDHATSTKSKYSSQGSVPPTTGTVSSQSWWCKRCSNLQNIGKYVIGVPLTWWMSTAKLLRMIVIFDLGLTFVSVFQMIYAFEHIYGRMDTAWRTYIFCIRLNDGADPPCEGKMDIRVSLGILQYVLLMMSTWAFWPVPKDETLHGETALSSSSYDSKRSLRADPVLCNNNTAPQVTSPKGPTVRQEHLVDSLMPPSQNLETFLTAFMTGEEAVFAMDNTSEHTSTTSL